MSVVHNETDRNAQSALYQFLSSNDPAKVTEEEEEEGEEGEVQTEQESRRAREH